MSVISQKEGVLFCSCIHLSHEQQSTGVGAWLTSVCETHEVAKNRPPSYASLLPMARLAVWISMTPTNLTTHWTRMITRLSMPLLNVNMPCPVLFWLVFIGLFHCRASSPAHYTLSNLSVPPPIHAMTSPGFNDVSRDNISLIVTQYLGYLHCIHILPYLCLYIIPWRYFISPRNLLFLSFPE
jgi:hypothetical protein